MTDPPTTGDDEWWRSAAIYQVYPRSFADGDGDGTGDLLGVLDRLPYLRDLGVDAMWFTPWYPSPMADGGYDVADYRAIDPAFGDLALAEELIATAARLGLRTIVDVVPNHVSDQHRWFQEALAAGPGSPERARFWFRPGRGEHGELAPNGWQSNFGGPAWSRLVEADGTPGDWYLHLFAPGQPDLNWDSPEVRAEFEDVLRFWFERGVAGVRIDSAALLVKDPTLPELDDEPGPGEHPYVDRDELQDVYRAWRRIADEYGGRALVGEIWLPDVERFGRYLRPDVLHTAFNFDFLACPWQVDDLRRSIDTTTEMHRAVGAPATWVLANHDVTRTVTRYGRADTSFAFERKRFGTPTDLELGRRRARAAALLTMALPGSLYLYQGEELGLPEVEDLPLERLEDPMHERSGGVDPGRDGCRVPLPWNGQQAPYGFSAVPNGGAVAPSWLPQPADWAGLTVQAQASDLGSMLSLYRTALRLRREHPDLGDGSLTWLTGDEMDLEGVLAFRRGPSLVSVTNLRDVPIDLPRHDRVLLSSAPLEGGRLPADTTVWLDVPTP
ncbi:glycoside hydrolase family 13 protein [Angustibacter luteus]|uniref:Glycoside hydrolase family 13 protein n=1 Tax=Angustibacter luteus TaxID=658456 RepID=A0ABW1JFD8_9ACTN